MSAGYARADVDAILARIGAKAPTLRAVRTDYLPPNRNAERPRPTGRHQVVLDRHPSKAFTLHLVPEDHPNQPLKRLAQYLSVSIEDARSLYQDFHELAEINRYGAWPIAAHCLPTPQAEPLSVVGADVIKRDARHYVIECLRDLIDVLPGVWSISIEAWTEFSHNGTQRRRTYFRFLRTPETELACIEASTLTFQFRHEVTHDPEHHYHDINEARRQVWLEQLGVEPADLAVVLHLLPMFALSLPVPGITLNDPEDVAAFWASPAHRARA
jgi:hypothetical protein